MRGLRAAVVGLAAAGLLTFGAGPAEATALTIDGDMHIGCFGCGEYGPAGNGAYFEISGLLGPEIVTRGTGWMTFTATATGGFGCALRWVLEGEIYMETTLQQVSSRVTVVFNGPAGYVYLHDLGWQGSIEFAITSPTGGPCGQAVDARFAGSVAGG